MILATLEGTLANHTLASAQLIESIPHLQVMVILFASAERMHYAGRAAIGKYPGQCQFDWSKRGSRDLRAAAAFGYPYQALLSHRDGIPD